MDTSYSFQSSSELKVYTDGIHMRCAAETRVKHWSSTSQQQNDAWLDGSGLRAKLDELASIADPTSTIPADARPHVALITAVGNAAYERNPLQISKPDFMALVIRCGFSPYVCEVWSSQQFHMSSHIHYGADENPNTLTILIRAPRNSSVVHLSMKIRLKDLSSVCLLTSANEGVVEALRSGWIHDFDASTFYPTQMLLLVLEERNFQCAVWFHRLWIEVSQLESATSMTRDSWKEPLPEERENWLSDYDNLLRDQHGVHTELSHCDTVITYLTRLEDFCLKSVQLIETTRKESGYGNLNKIKRAELEERIRFVGGKLNMVRDKLNEMLNRIRAQIQVSLSLVAQKDSKINLMVAADSNRIAALAARDSETMKTITIITLVFLPSSLVTSIWSADIFSLDQHSSWRVYVGTCIGVTATVLLIWTAYRAYRLRKRATDSEDGDTKERMMLKKIP